MYCLFVKASNSIFILVSRLANGSCNKNQSISSPHSQCTCGRERRLCLALTISFFFDTRNFSRSFTPRKCGIRLKPYEVLWNFYRSSFGLSGDHTQELYAILFGNSKVHAGSSIQLARSLLCSMVGILNVWNDAEVTKNSFSVVSADDRWSIVGKRLVRYSPVDVARGNDIL